MSKERKKYSSAEKAKIALEAIKSELSIAQISSKYAVHSTQINQWKRQLLNSLPEAFSNKQKQIITDHEMELSQLYEQIGRLKTENDFLKKKLEVFHG
jgi:transposase-like protein